MNITIIYACADNLITETLELNSGVSAVDAINQSSLSSDVKGFDLAQHKLGVWGEFIDPSYLLKDGDRLEIYIKAKGTKEDLIKKKQKASSARKL